MRRRIGWGPAAGWVVVAGAGWAAAQLLGEPAATSGPAPVAPPSSAAEPGPQPEFDCAEAMRATKGPPLPSPSGTPFAGDGGLPPVTSVVCDYAVEGR